MSSLFRVTIFPHGLCIIWWRRSQNHVLNWPVFKPGAAPVKVPPQQVVWACGRDSGRETKSWEGQHLCILGFKRPTSSFRSALGALPTPPLVSWLSGCCPHSHSPACLLCPSSSWHSPSAYLPFCTRLQAEPISCLAADST